jgi:hypothetical protein
VGTVRREVIVDRPADAVWARIGDPAAIAGWFPGMADVQVAEHDGTTMRTVTTGTGIALPEEIVTVDPILRRFQYRVTAPFLAHHLGTVDVFDLGDGRSLVSYATDCSPDAMALIIGGATGNALHELKRQLEAAPPDAETAPGAELAPDRSPNGRRTGAQNGPGRDRSARRFDGAGETTAATDDGRAGTDG